MRTSLPIFYVSSPCSGYAVKLIGLVVKVRFLSLIMLLNCFFIPGSLSSSSSSFRNERELGKSLRIISVSQQGCPQKCECIWRKGKSVVDCADSGLNKLPIGIRTDVQVLDFKGNKIKNLDSKVFLNHGLINLQKIHLSNCSLRRIAKDAFTSLSNLVDLDVSHNLMDSIPVEALRGCYSLRRLNLNNNPIRKVDQGSFHDLENLQTLELSDCEITAIDEKAFEGLINLNYLRLNGNKLRELSGYALESLVSLKQIKLEENRWFCDCRLRELQLNLIEKQVSLTVSPVCDKPARLKDSSWKSLSLDEFACKPEIKSIQNGQFIEERNGSIICQIQSIPESNVTWYFESNYINRHVVRNGTYMSFGKQFVMIKESSVGDIQISTLTITNIMDKDSGSYTCAASNKAGNAFATITIAVIAVLGEKDDEMMLLRGEEKVVGLILAIILGLLLIFLASCLVFLRYKNAFFGHLIKDRHHVLTNEETPNHHPHNSQNPSNENKSALRKETVVISNSSQKSNNTTVKLCRDSNMANSITPVSSHSENSSMARLNGNQNVSAEAASLDCDTHLNDFVNIVDSKCLQFHMENNIFHESPSQQSSNEMSNYSSSSLRPTTKSGDNPPQWVENAIYQPKNSIPRSCRRFSESAAFQTIPRLIQQEDSRVSIKDLTIDDSAAHDRWKYRRRSEDVIFYQSYNQCPPSDYGYTQNFISSDKFIGQSSFFNRGDAENRGTMAVNNGSEKNSLLRNGFTNYLTLQPTRGPKNVNFNLENTHENHELYSLQHSHRTGSTENRRRPCSIIEEGFNENETDILD